MADKQTQQPNAQPPKPAAKPPTKQNGKPAFKRTQVVIKRSFQFKLAAVVVVVMLAMVALLIADTYMSLNTIMKKVQYLDYVRNDIFNFLLVMAAKSVVFIFLLGAASLYFSNRIAGPIYRLEKDILKMIADSDLTWEFHLREKDELKELSEALNTLVKSLRSKLIADEQYQERVQQGLDELISYMKTAESLTREDWETILGQIERMSKDAATSPIQFKI